MKLATILVAGQDAPELGLVIGDKVKLISRALPDLPKTMIELVASWPRVQATLADLGADEDDLPLDSVKLLAPIPRPGKVLAIGLNYADHIAESGLPTPEHQLWFSKQSTSVTGPYDAVEIPKVSDQIDYEAELVVIIGKGGRHITKEQAPEHVFGYAVGNDVSVRDWQKHTPQWMLGKSFDTHAPFGPWITTADEIGEPHRLDILGVINGETRQNSNTRHLVFNIWDQIEHLSKAMTLEPGDIIFSGTPGGVGFALSPIQILKAGDVVRVEIAELGAIENRMQNEA